MVWPERAIQPMIADWLFKVFSSGAVMVRSPQPGEDTSKQPNLVVTCRPIADGTIAVDQADLAKRAYGRMIDQGALGVLARIEEHL